MGVRRMAMNLSKVICVIALWVVISVLAVNVAAVAQKIDLHEPASVEATAQALTPAEPSASQLVAFLRGHPELMVEMQQLAAESADALGHPLQPFAISDDLIYKRIEQDGDFRTKLVQWLEDRGYEVAASRSPASPPASVARTSTPTRQPPASAESSSSDDPNAPHVVPRTSPYNDLPSARDLYAQVPSQAPRLQRFGAEIFRTGSGNADNIPIDLPVGPDYVLGTGDGLNIDIWGGVSQRLTRTVDREGRIALPDAGTVVVAGLTLAQAQELIRNVLTPQIRNAKVDVSLTRVRTVRVYVVGDVQRPGAYDISALSTPLNALYAAGGPTARGSLRTVQHYRNEKLVRVADLYDFMLHGIRSDVERMQPGDTIVVPPVGPQVAIAGMVHRPAIYELLNEEQLNEVIALAGGVLVSAKLRQVNVERIIAHQERVLMSITIPEGSDAPAVTKALGSFVVQDGDRITIAPILPYSYKTIYLEGHVARPGKYPFHEGMQLSDIVRSYQDLLPEPARRAEIVRLLAPDYRPVTIAVDLDEVLDGSDPISLQPFDTVRVYGRYEQDPPKVRIDGEVMHPGEYPLSKGMTAAGLVEAAGGFKRSAYRDEAELASYVTKDDKKVLVDQKTIAIGKAVDGAKAADLPLAPNDQLSIRQLSGWNDIGAAVTLRGQMTYPGSYSIHDGERLSSVLRRAGGFRPDAYALGSRLERVEVRQLAERNRAELIRRIETAAATTKVSGKAEEQAATLQAVQQQEQQLLAALRSQPASGRVVLAITNDISKWEGTPADIELRAGDSLDVPKKPTHVLINGEVYNPTAITYSPGKNAAWYLEKAGGTTEFARKKSIFIVRANGSVVGQNSSSWLRGGNVLAVRMQPGDSIIVPERIISGSSAWKELFGTAQFMTSVALTAAAIGHL